MGLGASCCLHSRAEEEEEDDCAESSIPLNLNESPNYPLSALMVAAKYGDVQKVKKLLNAGANVNLCSSTAFGGATPLSFALQAESLPIVKLLVTAGADVNARNGFGYTVLIDSLLRPPYEYRDDTEAYRKCIRYLLKNGADPHLTSGFSSPPRDTMAYAVANTFINYAMIVELVRAGERRWEMVPVPCKGLELVLVSVCQEELREVFIRLEPPMKESFLDRIKTLRRFLPEPELCVHMTCLSFDVDDVI